MAVVPESEIRVNLLACQIQKTGEICGKLLATIFADFRLQINYVQEKWQLDISHKPSTHQDHKFPQGLNQNSLTPMLLELGCPNYKIKFREN